MSPPFVSPLVLSAASGIPGEVEEVLRDFETMHGSRVRLWSRTGKGWELLRGAGEGDPAEPGAGRCSLPGMDDLSVEAVCEPSGPGATATVRFLAAAVERELRHHGEVDFFSRELAERYEEITLLYSISEILGSVISFEEAAGTILREVVDVLGARRAILWVHRPQTDTLIQAAAVGSTGPAEPLPAQDASSVTAEVFRSREPVLLEEGDEFPREPGKRLSMNRESVLSVPVSYSPPDGETRTVGVINLAGRESGDAFTAGDLKLLSAIASQVGAAVENSRLVGETLHQERILRELELAHDLQLKLLPSIEPFRDRADVAARCLPAESVGGDFYHLFRLGEGRLGVMIGDVSSHGFSAALIMALTMSAVAIHASEGDPPAEVLRRVHRALVGELRSTEMYFTLFYGVIDPEQHRICYANAGHPHAFRVRVGGEADRLLATSPPIGIAEEGAFAETEEEWLPGRDLLLLFTDGLLAGRPEGERASEARLVADVEEQGDAPAEVILERILEAEAGAPEAADDRTVLLVRV